MSVNKVVAIWELAPNSEKEEQVQGRKRGIQSTFGVEMVVSYSNGRAFGPLDLFDSSKEMSGL